MGMLLFPKAFLLYFGKVSEKSTLKTYNGYNWTITTNIVDDRAVLD
jgi:hypothetical protein